MLPLKRCSKRVPVSCRSLSFLHSLQVTAKTAVAVSWRPPYRRRGHASSDPEYRNVIENGWIVFYLGERKTAPSACRVLFMQYACESIQCAVYDVGFIFNYCDKGHSLWLFHKATALTHSAALANNPRWTQGGDSQSILLIACKEIWQKQIHCVCVRRLSKPIRAVVGEPEGSVDFV